MCNELENIFGNFDINSEKELDWQEEVKNKFSKWLAELSQTELNETEQDCDDAPDLYSFYSELCALRAESKKISKKNQDSFYNLGEFLKNFQNTLQTMAKKQKEFEKEGMKSILEKFFKPLTEIFNRFDRIYDKLQNPPKTTFWSKEQKWKNAWNKLNEGFSLVYDHLNEFLENEGIYRIDTQGKKFDPYTMTAVKAVKTDIYEPNTVVNEISPGYLFKNSVLKLAEVEVAVEKGNK